jgi:hypothetical protein
MKMIAPHHQNNKQATLLPIAWAGEVRKRVKQKFQSSKKEECSFSSECKNQIKKRIVHKLK